MFYVAVDIGCIECGEDSAVLGVFDDEKAAQLVCNEHEERQAKDWHGQHYFQVFPIESLNEVNIVKY